MADHAKFSPSKMQRIIACPGSVALESTLPDKRSDDANNGTVAHDIAATCLKMGGDAADYVGLAANVDERGAVIWETGGQFKIDDEFADYVQVYIDTVRNLAVGKIMLVEQRVEFSEVVGVKNQFGTSDVIVIDLENREMLSIDLKFGVGVKVWASYAVDRGVVLVGPERKGNEQCMTYAVAARETLGDLVEGIDKFRCVIIQPRLDHYDEFECGIKELDAHAAEMRNAVLVATVAQKDYEADREIQATMFQAGDKQCKFCKAKGFCPTYAARVSEVVFEDITALDEENLPALAARPPIRVPGPSAIGARYGVLDMVEAWCKGVRAEIERMVLGGMEVMGPDGQPMKLVPGKKGNRKWEDENIAEAVLQGFMPADKLHTKKLVTPAKAGTFFGEKRKTPSPHWAEIKKLYKQPEGKPSIALGSDPRPVWTGKMEDCEFEAIEDGE